MKEQIDLMDKPEELPEDEDLGNIGDDRLIEAEKSYIEYGRIKRGSKFKNLAKKSAEVKKNERDEIKMEEFKQLIDYIEGDKKVCDSEIIEKFKNASDSTEKLNLLRFMSIADRIECISKYSESPVAVAYLKDRLDFYQKFINGEATKRGEVYDDESNSYVIKQIPINSSQANPESINLGLLRDSMYAAMQGTPEMAAVKIATKNINQINYENYLNQKNSDQEIKKPSKIRSVVEFWGYYSGIDKQSIGMYEHIVNLYKRCLSQIQEEIDNQEISKEEIEHRAVLLMAKRLENAYCYNSIMNNSASPYDANFNEAVIAGQLGYRVMRQMAGMRNKIQKTNFSHIDRFIGKSGDNKYAKEKNRLDYQIEFLTNAADKKEKDEFAAEENLIAINKLDKWRQSEIARLAKKANEGKISLAESALISGKDSTGVKLNIGDHNLSEVDEYRQKIEKAEREYKERKGYLQNRTPERLLADLEARKEIVDKRFEKRKSLAQKALDLHFAINHLTNEEREDSYSKNDNDDAKPIKPFSGIIDWINFAPLGTIKRSHRLLRQGVDHKLIIEQALEDIILKKRNINLEDQKTQKGEVFDEYNLKDIAGAAQKADKEDVDSLKVIHELVDKAADGDYKAKNEIEYLMKTANILDRNGYHLNIKEISELSGKVGSLFGFARMFKFYDLDQIEKFLQSGINDFNEIAEAKNASIKSGYDFSDVEIAAIAKKGYHDQKIVIDASRFFNREEFKKLIDKDINLYAAVNVHVICRQYGRQLTVEQILEVVNTIEEKDLANALKILTLDQVLKIYSQDIDYSTFGLLKDALASHKYAADFDSVIGCLKELSALVSNSNDSLSRMIQNMGDVFDYYSFDEIKELIKIKMDLRDMAKVRLILKEKNIDLDFGKTLKLAKIAKTKYSSDRSYHISRALSKFGEAGMFQLVNASCPLDVAAVVKDKIDSGQYQDKSYQWKKIDASVLEKIKEMGLDAIIAISKSGGEVEAVAKTISAGFNLDEIAKYPFLISSLIEKK